MPDGRWPHAPAHSTTAMGRARFPDDAVFNIDSRAGRTPLLRRLCVGLPGFAGGGQDLDGGAGNGVHFSRGGGGLRAVYCDALVLQND